VVVDMVLLLLDAIGNCEQKDALNLGCLSARAAIILKIYDTVGKNLRELGCLIE
jgi:hypothetical protein